MSRGENVAKKLIVALEATKANENYDSHFHRFLVSISMRTVEYFHRSSPIPRQSQLAIAHRSWRHYLLNKSRTCDPYSHHVFVVFDPQVGLHRAMGGRIMRELGLVLSQVGPLMIVGWYDKRQLTNAEIQVWNQSLVEATGGTVTPLTEWRVGTNITTNFAAALSDHEREVHQRILSKSWKKKSD